jgi:hypothetical protein
MAFVFGAVGVVVDAVAIYFIVIERSHIFLSILPLQHPLPTTLMILKLPRIHSPLMIDPPPLPIQLAIPPVSLPYLPIHIDIRASSLHYFGPF